MGNYLAYEFYNSILGQVDPSESKAVSKLSSGGLSGVTGTLLTYPLDLLRTQTAIQEGRGHVSMLHQARMVMAQNGGVFGLWTGVGTAVLTKFPSFALLFGVNEMS